MDVGGDFVGCGLDGRGWKDSAHDLMFSIINIIQLYYTKGTVLPDIYNLNEILKNSNSDLSPNPNNPNNLHKQYLLTKLNIPRIYCTHSCFLSSVTFKGCNILFIFLAWLFDC